MANEIDECLKRIAADSQKVLADLERIKQATADAGVLTAIAAIRENELENLRIIKGISDSSIELSDE